MGMNKYRVRCNILTYYGRIECFIDSTRLSNPLKDQFVLKFSQGLKLIYFWQSVPRLGGNFTSSIILENHFVFEARTKISGHKIDNEKL